MTFATSTACARHEPTAVSSWLLYAEWLFRGRGWIDVNELQWLLANRRWAILSGCRAGRSTHVNIRRTTQLGLRLEALEPRVQLPVIGVSSEFGVEIGFLVAAARIWDACSAAREAGQQYAMADVGLLGIASGDWHPLLCPPRTAVLNADDPRKLLDGLAHLSSWHRGVSVIGARPKLLAMSADIGSAGAAQEKSAVRAVRPAAA